MLCNVLNEASALRWRGVVEFDFRARKDDGDSEEEECSSGRACILFYVLHIPFCDDTPLLDEFIWCSKLRAIVDVLRGRCW